MEKRIGIGVEFFKEMVDKNYYYVDKTLFVKDLLDKGGKINLFTRPRRFGKTLALSMIRTFFEQDTDYKGNVTDNSRYFEGMKIADAGESYKEHMGKYPVISLSLKSAKQPDFEMAYQCMVQDIAYEYDRHRYVLNGDSLSDTEKKVFESLMNRKADRAQYATSLKFLSECLRKYHGKNVIILIDEYDVPLENSYFRGFYSEMTDFIRSLFESALKTNGSLEFAVITGCLRISKESIFTGLNNLEVISILNADYAEYFGFTQLEVEQILNNYAMSNKFEEVKQWYNGYLFGKTEVYNPWSVINYVKAVVSDINAFPKSYWSNTSSNSIVCELIERADMAVKKEIEGLIAGGTIVKPVHEDITYEDVYKTQDNLWNFLFFTGYLKAEGQQFDDGTIYLTLRIPNEEIRYIYRNTIMEWFNEQIKGADLKGFYKAVLSGNAEEMAEFITKQLSASISYYDNAEKFYHGYLTGLFSAMEGYELQSNKEHGDGRPDIVLNPFNPKAAAVIIEIKRADRFTLMDKMCNEALAQIEERQYAADLFEQGYTKVLKYGICFCRKSCEVKAGGM